MKNFIVSDLHGNGDIYYSIMNYLENVSNDTKEEITLHINGDLIDKGLDSAAMLIDVRDKIINPKDIKINYLGGNHELLMYQASKTRNCGLWDPVSDWLYGNGGEYTAYGLEDRTTPEEEDEIINFVSNLKIYKKFKETLDNKPIVLVHAKCPKVVKDDCDIRIKDDSFETFNAVWARKEEPWINKKSHIGNEEYFTIVGHTPVDNNNGYEYYKDDNTLNIDGGCAPYAVGYKKYDHTPLVEIDSKNNRLIILTFNNNNEIISGNYFSSGKSAPMNEEELLNHRKYLRENSKVRRLD